MLDSRISNHLVARAVFKKYVGLCAILITLNSKWTIVDLILPCLKKSDFIEKDLSVALESRSTNYWKSQYSIECGIVKDFVHCLNHSNIITNDNDNDRVNVGQSTPWSGVGITAYDTNPRKLGALQRHCWAYRANIA